MRSWIDVATLAKSRKQDGRFVAKSAAGLPFLLVEDDEVAFVPPQLDLVRRAHVVSVKYLDDTSAEVQFAEISSKEDAQNYLGMHCLIRRDDIDVEAFETPSLLWEGWSVLDDEVGFVGIVSDVIDNSAQSLLEVRLGESVSLIPIVDEIVRDIDVANETIRVSVPNGLLDL